MIMIVDDESGRTLHLRPDEFADYLIYLVSDPLADLSDWSLISEVASRYDAPCEGFSGSPSHTHRLISWVFGDVPLRPVEDDEPF